MEERGELDSDYAVSRNRKGGTIFLVDARAGMFSGLREENSLDGRNKFQTVMKCCRKYVEKIVQSKENEYIGVVWFGVLKDNHSNPFGSDLSLSLPSAEKVKILELLESITEEEMFTKLKLSPDVSVADALWYCCSELTKKREIKEGDKRILLFTDDSEPHGTFPDKAFKARKRACDLKTFGVKLQVFPMGETMEYDKFYKELVELANGETNDVEEVKNITTREELTDQLKRLHFSRRCYARLKLDLGKGVKCGLSLYSLFKEEKVVPSQTLEKSTNQPVKSVRQTFDEVTGELLLPSDLKELVKVGGDDVVFTSEEKSALKKIMDPGLTLIGFKDASDCDESLHCGGTCFIYPEESLVKGSAGLLKALADQCLESRKVLLCAMTSRVGAHIQYVCLYPSQPTSGLAGFHLTVLPFDDDVRKIPVTPSPDVKDEDIELAKKVVKRLTKKGGYKVSNFKNPKLKRVWYTLKALALEKEMPTEIEDSTEPEVVIQTEALGDLSDNFVQAMGLDNQPSTSARKRPSTSSSTQPKRPKGNSNDCIDDAQFIENFKTAVNERKVEKFTVVQLKKFLTLQNIDVTGKKKLQLVEDVYNVTF